MTGGGKVGDVIAIVISILLCSSGNGSGSVMVSGRGNSQAEMVSTTFLEGGIGKSDAAVPSRLSAPDHHAEWSRDGTTCASAGAPIYTGVRAESVAMRPRSSSQTRPRRGGVRS